MRVDKFFKASSWFPPPQTLRQRTKRHNMLPMTCDATPWPTACRMSIVTQCRRNPIASTSQEHIALPLAVRKAMCSSWVQRVARQPASALKFDHTKAGIVELSLQSQHIRSLEFHCENLSNSQYQAQSPRNWQMAPRQPLANGWPPFVNRRPW